MFVLQSSAEVILIAVPLAGFFLAGYFRLEERTVSPSRPQKLRNQIADLNKATPSISADPD